MIHIAESGIGQPIILLHGFCENHQIWHGLTAKLASNYKVLAVDLPGFGHSIPLPENCTTLEEIAGIIAKEITQRNLGRAFILGHSLGGYVALALAEIYPQLFQGLILVNSTTFSDREDKKRTRDKVISFISKHGVAPFISQFVEEIFYKKEDHLEAFESVKQMGLSCAQELLTRYTAMMRDRVDRTFLLQQLEIPTLIIAGDKDRIIPKSQSQEMINYLPEGQSIILESCGHMAMYEKPKELYQGLIQFVHRYVVLSN